jgi:hypothetical protein
MDLTQYLCMEDTKIHQRCTDAACLEIMLISDVDSSIAYYNALIWFWRVQTYWTQIIRLVRRTFNPHRIRSTSSSHPPHRLG